MMLGSQCSPCCDKCPADGKPRTDPKDEGTWVPSGEWPSVSWTFSPNQGDESGNTWFFFGSQQTSRIGGNASVQERRDWGNICNWYSSKKTSPTESFTINESLFNKRATRLPPVDAVVHVYTTVDTSSVGQVSVNKAYFWGSSNFFGELITTQTELQYGSVFVFFSGNHGLIDGGAILFATCQNFGTINGGAEFNDNSSNSSGTVNGGATFNDSSQNIFTSTVNDGATFNDNSLNHLSSKVNGGATFNGTSKNQGGLATTVNGGATFNDKSNNQFATVNGGATFNGASQNITSAIVNGGATFNDNSANSSATVNGGATFNGSSQNINAIVNDGATFNGLSQNRSFAIVNGGATFNDDSRNGASEFDGARVNGGATFNDDACSVYTLLVIGIGRFFTAHPTEAPTCNGSAPTYANRGSATCGCG